MDALSISEVTAMLDKQSHRDFAASLRTSKVQHLYNIVTVEVTNHGTYRIPAVTLTCMWECGDYATYNQRRVLLELANLANYVVSGSEKRYDDVKDTICQLAIIAEFEGFTL